MFTGIFRVKTERERARGGRQCRERSWHGGEWENEADIDDLDQTMTSQQSNPNVIIKCDVPLNLDSNGPSDPPEVSLQISGETWQPWFSLWIIKKRSCAFLHNSPSPTQNSAVRGRQEELRSPRSYRRHKIQACFHINIEITQNKNNWDKIHKHSTWSFKWDVQFSNTNWNCGMIKM